jgi:hypothetical protein
LDQSAALVSIAFSSLSERIAHRRQFALARETIRNEVAISHRLAVLLLVFSESCPAPVRCLQSSELAGRRSSTLADPLEISQTPGSVTRVVSWAIHDVARSAVKPYFPPTSTLPDAKKMHDFRDPFGA